MPRYAPSMGRIELSPPADVSGLMETMRTLVEQHVEQEECGDERAVAPNGELRAGRAGRSCLRGRGGTRCARGRRVAPRT